MNTKKVKYTEFIAGYQVGEYWPGKGIFQGKDEDGNEVWDR